MSSIKKITKTFKTDSKSRKLLNLYRESNRTLWSEKEKKNCNNEKSEYNNQNCNNDTDEIMDLPLLLTETQWFKKHKFLAHLNEQKSNINNIHNNNNNKMRLLTPT